ncbi:hypothetical protein [Vibrio azureus]|uniref:hypothetical protein n=1 Tax=Vibrio azureus TaxID=512649 RepID=UPI00039C5BEB|nr:hypothetical protein [Vibrio azureus]
MSVESVRRNELADAKEFFTSVVFCVGINRRLFSTSLFVLSPFDDFISSYL